MTGEGDSTKAHPLIFLGISVAVLVAWILAGWLLSGDPHRGTFGDMFGAVNALFSGLALAGIIMAILLQREDLRVQVKELTLSRGELAQQGEQLAEQARAMKELTMIEKERETAHFRIVSARQYTAILGSFHVEIVNKGGHDSAIESIHVKYLMKDGGEAPPFEAPLRRARRIECSEDRTKDFLIRSGERGVFDIIVEKTPESVYDVTAAKISVVPVLGGATEYNVEGPFSHTEF